MEPVKKKMELFRNNSEKSLARLRELIKRGPIERGWKTDLAEWFNVPSNLLSRWIGRNSIPKKRREYAIKRGYPLEKWYIEPEVPGSDLQEVQDLAHQELIFLFKDRGKAKQLNLLALEIERAAPEKLDNIIDFMRGILVGLERKKKKKRSV